MNSSRNKKLLASFLTALGLSMNSANVSADFNAKQFLSNARFACKFLGGQKVKERNDLSGWVHRVEMQLTNFENHKVGVNRTSDIIYRNDFILLYNDLFYSIKKMLNRREEFDSEFVKSLNLGNNPKLKEFINSVNGLNGLNDDNINSALNSACYKIKYGDLLGFCKLIYNNAHGGKLSAWDKSFNKTLESLCKNEKLTELITKYQEEDEQRNIKQNSNVQNNNLNVQNNNNFNQNVMPINNNSQEYHGEYWKQNCEYIAQAILNDFKNENGVLKQAIDPSKASNWLATMIMGVQKHAISSIDEKIKQNTKYSEQLERLKKILQGDTKLDIYNKDFSFDWNNEGKLEFYLKDDYDNIFIFLCNNRRVNVYFNGDGFYNPIYKIKGSDKKLILSFDLTTDPKYQGKYEQPNPQRRNQNMNMMGQNNFGMGMQNYPNNMMQMNNNNFNQINQNYPNNQFQQGFNNRFVSNNQFNNNGNWQ